MSTAVVVVAAGSGSRMGPGAGPKQYLMIAGEPLLARTVTPFLDHPGIGRVVVVLPARDVAEPPEWLAGLRVQRVAGGPERGDSVWNGLQALPATAEVVLVHDGARPFVTRETIDRVIAGARKGAVIAAVPASDTLKEVDASGSVVQTLDRSVVWRAQTPQGFPRELILEVHRRAREEGIRGTDDAALCEHYGIPVRVVEGSYANIKITRPEDLPIAEALARSARTDPSTEPTRDGAYHGAYGRSRPHDL